jgi:hypothetical protein
MPRRYGLSLNFLLHFTLVSSRTEIQVMDQTWLGRVDEVSKRTNRDLLYLIVEHVPGTAKTILNWVGLSPRLWFPAVSNYAFVRRPDGQYDRQNGDSFARILGRQVYGASGHSVAHETVRFHSGVNAALLNVTGFRIGLADATGDRCVNGNIPAN